MSYLKIYLKLLFCKALWTSWFVWLYWIVALCSLAIIVPEQRINHFLRCLAIFTALIMLVTLLGMTLGLMLRLQKQEKEM
jgi:hypothetical protein